MTTANRPHLSNWGHTLSPYRWISWIYMLVPVHDRFYKNPHLNRLLNPTSSLGLLTLVKVGTQSHMVSEWLGNFLKLVHEDLRFMITQITVLWWGFQKNFLGPIFWRGLYYTFPHLE